MPTVRKRDCCRQDWPRVSYEVMVMVISRPRSVTPRWQARPGEKNKKPLFLLPDGRWASFFT
jgi:hypothetical protein